MNLIFNFSVWMGSLLVNSVRQNIQVCISQILVKPDNYRKVNWHRQSKHNFTFALHGYVTIVGMLFNKLFFSGSEKKSVKWENLKNLMSYAKPQTKLMRLGVPNRIIKDTDFKPANFYRKFWSDSDFKGNFELTITISI